MAISVTRSAGPSPSGAVRRWLNLPAICLIAALVVAWQLLVSTGMMKAAFLPSPSSIAVAFIQSLGSGELVANVGHTLSAALLGWLLGCAVGLLLGILLGLFHQAWRFSMATVDFLRSIPAICFVTVSALIFGYSLEMELLVTAYGSIWPVAVTTIEGIRGAERSHQDLSRVLQFSRPRFVLSMLLPSSAGSILVGVRIALALAITLAVASEMVGNPHGLGYALIMEQQALRPAAMFSYLIVVGLLGLLLNGVLIWLARLLMPGIAAAASRSDR